MLKILVRGVSGMKVLKIKLFFAGFILLGVSKVSNANEKILKEIGACPSSPNCVSSLTNSKEHKMDAWPADSEAVLLKVKEAALKEPRAKLISESGTHLQFTFKSLLFRFVDDVWFAYKDGEVHFKSASRTGYKDFGVNKERIERIKSRVF